MADLKIKSSKSIVDYIANGIKHVCETFKDRAPGTESERKSQEYFRDELKKYSDDVQMEDFDVHPHAFMGFIIIAAIFGLTSIAFYWMTPISIIFPIIGVVLDFCAVLMFVFEFLLYRSFVDFLFPKRVSRNVMAVRKPTGEVKRRIIFGGHADAANEWTYSLHGQIKTLAPVMVGGILGMFLAFGFSIAILIASLVAGTPIAITGVWMVLGIICLVFAPFIFALLFFINWGVIVDGANDNMSACFISAAVLKEMADKNFRYENTEVCCLISGSEEAGLRGAKAYAKRHQKELLDTETVFISMDTMREVEQLMVYSRGCTGTVHNSEAVSDLIAEAGKNCGIDMPRSPLYPGAVDAEGFTMYGIRAAGFCGVNHDPKTYYHTRHDTWTNINKECIGISLDICKEAARLYDAAGGIAKYEK